MTIPGIALLITLLSLGLALRANARFRSADRLPMQWWITGEVTWSAPRPVALGFIPALAAVVFAALYFVGLNVPPRAGQQGMVVPTFVVIGLMFLGVQLLHLWLIEKTLRRNDP